MQDNKYVGNLQMCFHSLQLNTLECAVCWREVVSEDSHRTELLSLKAGGEQTRRCFSPVPSFWSGYTESSFGLRFPGHRPVLPLPPVLCHPSSAIRPLPLR